MKKSIVVAAVALLLLYDNDPVVVGEWLMKAADKRIPWEQVQAHLLQTIFLATPEDDFADCTGGRAGWQ